mmetsp:Transcript_1626/g.3569  ORF Transcript_1626/g.3569 Transcript_1626/m.3569 type:complete len:134 (-) Transcript_1626:324-725(-)|eukprot:scaffold21700_cov164-Amphora_coffeaeformis.AAC.9
MTALSNLLSKDSASDEGELDIASLAPTVATADSVKQKKTSIRGSKKGGKRNGDSASSLGASLSNLLEKCNESNGSIGSDPDEITCITTDSREHSSSSLMRKTKRGGRKKGHKYADSSDDEKAVHRERTIMMVD